MFQSVIGAGQSHETVSIKKESQFVKRKVSRSGDGFEPASFCLPAGRLSYHQDKPADLNHNSHEEKGEPKRGRSTDLKITG